MLHFFDYENMYLSDNEKKYVSKTHTSIVFYIILEKALPICQYGACVLKWSSSQNLLFVKRLFILFDYFYFPYFVVSCFVLIMSCL